MIHDPNPPRIIGDIMKSMSTTDAPMQSDRVVPFFLKLPNPTKYRMIRDALKENNFNVFKSLLDICMAPLSIGGLYMSTDHLKSWFGPNLNDADFTHELDIDEQHEHLEHLNLFL